jgi:uncharacterized damage-inducible protein DinB
MTSLNPPLNVPEPHTEGEQFCFALRRNMEGVLRIIEAVPQEALSWRPPLQDANTLGALAVHAAASGEWWILACVRGDQIDRDRDAEFRATTTAAEVRQRFENWYAQVESLIRDQPPEWFGQISKHPNGDRTNRRCLMHSVEHLAQHFGHMEITADLWRSRTQ